MRNKEKCGLLQVIYEEMEKSKPKYAAVAAFKHKPYRLDWKEEERCDGEEKQRF